MGDRAEAIEVPDTLSQGLQLPLTLDDESHALSLLEGEPVAGDSKAAIRTDAGRDVGQVVGSVSVQSPLWINGTTYANVERIRVVQCIISAPKEVRDGRETSTFLPEFSGDHRVGIIRYCQ